MNNQEMRNDARRRLARTQAQTGGQPPKKDQTVPATDTPSEQKDHIEELPQLVLALDKESQIGANLEDGDVIIYLKAVTFKPEVFKNIAKRGPGAVAEYADKQPAYFVFTREDCAGDVIKAFLEGSLKGNK